MKNLSVNGLLEPVKISQWMRVVATTLLLLMGSLAGTGIVHAGEKELSAPAVVNINTADAATLASMLKGIGLKKAQAIVVYREQYGEFKTLSELSDVKGIGSATLAKNEAVIVLK